MDWPSALSLGWTSTWPSAPAAMDKARELKRTHWEMRTSGSCSSSLRSRKNREWNKRQKGFEDHFSPWRQKVGGRDDAPWSTFKLASMKVPSTIQCRWAAHKIVYQSSSPGLKMILYSEEKSHVLNTARKLGGRHPVIHAHTELGEMEKSSLNYGCHQQAWWPRAVNIHWRNFGPWDGRVRERLLNQESLLWLL